MGIPNPVTLEGWRWWRNQSRTNLFFFCRRVLGYTDVCDIHLPIIENLQRFEGGEDTWPAKELNGKVAVGTLKDGMGYVPRVPLPQLMGPRKTLAVVSRGHLKTTIRTIGHKIQFVLNYPDMRILLSSATDAQVKKFLSEIKKHFQYNEVFRYLFPEFCPQGNLKEFGNQEEFTVPCRRVHRKEPTFSTVTVGSVMAGGHFDDIDHDDVVDKENVRTVDQIAVVESHLQMCGPLVERYNIAEGSDEGCTGWVNFTGTRYHFSDAYGKIIEYEEKRQKDAEREKKEYKPEYKILVMAATKDGGSIFDDKTRPTWPQRFPLKELRRIWADPLEGGAMFNCTPAGSPVLMSDWSERPIESLEPGDEIIGFAPNSGSGKMGAVKTRIKRVFKTRGIVNRITTVSGRLAYCTADHKWWTKRRATEKEPNRKEYLPARVGWPLQSVVSPLPELTQDQQRWLDWLGGMLDGEGSCSQRNTVFLAQSTKTNPEVCEMIDECLEALGLDTGNYQVKDGAKLWMLKGGRSMMRLLLLRSRMAKRQRIIDTLYRRSSIIVEHGNGEHEVTAIEPIGEHDVYALETETGNYVVWGFASSNSQYQQNPIPDGTGLIDDVKQIVWIPSNVISKLYARLNLFVTIDLAGMESGTSKDNDYTVLTLAGWDRSAALYALEIIHGRPDPFQVVEMMFDMYKRHPRIRLFKMEKESHARVLLPFLRREMEKRGVFLPVEAIPRDNQVSKEQKIRALIPWFRSGTIRFSEAITCKDVLQQEILRFPRWHDDILDTLRDQMETKDGGLVADAIPRPKIQQPTDAVHGHFLGFGAKGVELWEGQREETMLPSYDMVTGL